MQMTHAEMIKLMADYADNVRAGRVPVREERPLNATKARLKPRPLPRQPGVDALNLLLVRMALTAQRVRRLQENSKSYMVIKAQSRMIRNGKTNG
jgi:hypothetical protein